VKALLLLLVATAAAAPPTRMTLKDGTVYVLREPPRLAGTRLVFTTQDGKVYSIDEKEVDAIGTPATPTPSVRGHNPLDSHALGAIARQQRARKGKAALVAPRGEGPARPRPKTPPKKKPR
jgi:hypothetical protein